MRLLAGAVAASHARRISASDCGRSFAITPSPQKSRPTRPANRPVNALTHDQVGLIVEMRNPPGMAGSHSRKEMSHV